MNSNNSNSRVLAYFYSQIRIIVLYKILVKKVKLNVPRVDRVGKLIMTRCHDYIICSVVQSVFRVAIGFELPVGGSGKRELKNKEKII